jgi:hypothetical protein
MNPEILICIFGIYNILSLMLIYLHLQAILHALVPYFLGFNTFRRGVSTKIALTRDMICLALELLPQESSRK